MQPPSRSLQLTGATNFRDLGGYVGREGRRVRWRRIFRSDHLAGLTPRDATLLAELGLARAFDFRGIHERAAAAYELPGVRQHPLPIEPTVVQSLQAIVAAGRNLTARDAVEVMQETYRWFVRDNSHRFAELFHHLLEDDAPLVFHCTAGKDRTGLAAALILHALDVPRETVVEDFLLTNQLYRRPAGAVQSDTPQEVLDVLWRVRLEFLEAALQAIDGRYGGVGRYLEELGVGQRERERLAELYLEQRP
jgi:protein-tyrosine phosphatase